MQQEPPNPSDSPIPPDAMPGGAPGFDQRIGGPMDGQPGNGVTVAKASSGMEEMFDRIAAGLYSLASMLVGEGEDSARLVESAVTNAEVSVCHDPNQARRSSRRVLSTAALQILQARNPGCLAAPEGLAPASTCIEDDDLSAAGVSSDELENMIAGPDRDRVRNWLAGLPATLRTVFVLRAVAGFNTADTAGLLEAHAGPGAAQWTPAAVSEVFRQALCSLASQLIHSTAAH
jgi:hypothetical protein